MENVATVNIVRGGVAVLRVVRLHASTNTLNQQNGKVVISANPMFHFDKNLQATHKILYFSRRTITVLHYSTSFNLMTTHRPPTSPAITSSHVPRTAADSALTPAHLPVCRAHHYTRVQAPSTHNVSTARVARRALSHQPPRTRPWAAPLAPSQLSSARVHRRATAREAAACMACRPGRDSASRMVTRGRRVITSDQMCAG
jgi:hypothetical protein